MNTDKEKKHKSFGDAVTYAIDEEINRRAWDQYNSEDHSNESYGVYREHGWYLPNDD